MFIKGNILHVIFNKQTLGQRYGIKNVSKKCYKMLLSDILTFLSYLYLKKKYKS